MSRVDPEQAPDSWTVNSNEETLPDPLGTCPYCKKGPAHKKQITRHVNEEHPDETPLNDPGWLREQYKEHTIREIADKLNASEYLVNRRMHEFGIDVTRVPADAAAKLDDENYMRTEYAEPPVRSAPDIADELGVSSATVYAALDQHGIEERHKCHTLPRDDDSS